MKDTPTPTEPRPTPTEPRPTPTEPRPTPTEPRPSPGPGPAALKAAAAMVVILLAATGCLGGIVGGKGLGKQTVTVKHYPSCYNDIISLRKDAEVFSGKISQATLGSAMAGALAGAFSGDGKNIAIGVAVGATVGFIASAEVQGRKQSERYAAYKESLDEDYNTLNNALKVARGAHKCYERAYDKLVRDHKAGKIPEAEARERLQEIRDGAADVKAILQYYKDASVANLKTFDDTLLSEDKRTEDKLTAASRRDFQRRRDRNRGVVDAAQLLDESLDVLIDNANRMSANLSAGLGPKAPPSVEACLGGRRAS